MKYEDFVIRWLYSIENHLVLRKCSPSDTIRPAGALTSLWWWRTIYLMWGWELHPKRRFWFVAVVVLRAHLPFSCPELSQTWSRRLLPVSWSAIRSFDYHHMVTTDNVDNDSLNWDAFLSPVNLLIDFLLNVTYIDILYNKYNILSSQ